MRRWRSPPIRRLPSDGRWAPDSIQGALQARGERAADAGKDQKAGEHDRDRIEGMAEEQDEALDEGDLDEQEREAERKEVGQRSAPSAPRRRSAAAAAPAAPG